MVESVTSTHSRNVNLPWYVEEESSRSEDNEIIFTYDPGIEPVSIFQEAFSDDFLSTMSLIQYFDVNRHPDSGKATHL
jgi:hypothetical protein